VSVLVYGNETFKMCRIEAYETRNVFDESGIDYLYTEHRVSITAMVSADLNPGMKLEDIIARIRQNLKCSRQTLDVFVGEDNSDTLTPPDHGSSSSEPPEPHWGHDGKRHGADQTQWDGVDDDGVDEDQGDTKPKALDAGVDRTGGKFLQISAPDIKGGPYCESATFSRISGHRTAIVTATFVAHQHLCGSPPIVLSNRWTTSASIDQNQYARITVNGRIVINPKLDPGGADKYRHLTLFLLRQNFIVESADFRLSQDGLTLDYTIVHKELYRQYPPDIMSLDAEYGENTEVGAITYADMTVTATAKRDIPKAVVLGRVAQIILSRLDLAVPQGGAFDPKEKDQLLNASMRESLTENRITMYVRVRKPQTKNQQLVMPLDPRTVGKELPVTKNVADFKVRGTAAYDLIMADWKDCCTNADFTNPLFTSNSNSEFPMEQFTFSTGTLPEPQPDKVSPENRQDPYKSYGHISEYEKITGVVTLPLGQSIGSGDSERTALHVRLHQPYTKKHVRYSAERHNDWPGVPKAASPDNGGQITNSKIETEPPKLAADLNGFVYALSGQHEIIYDHVLDETQDEVVGGVNPMYTMEVADSYLPSGAFRDDLTEDPDA
jgi:hypothetical protein